MAAVFVNFGQRRPRALWRLAGHLLILLALALAMQAVLHPAASELGRAVALGPVEALVLPSLLVILLGTWLAGRLLDRRPFADFGWRMSRLWWLDLAFGLLLGAALQAALFATMLALGWIEVLGRMAFNDSYPSFAAALLAAAGACIGVGISEELFTRGYQLRNLAEGLNRPRIGPRGSLTLALLLTSAAFGLLHLPNENSSPTAAANIALAGVLLGLGYVLTGQLALPIGLHVSWNFAEGCLFGMPVSGQPAAAAVISSRLTGPEAWTGGLFGPEAGLVGTIAVLAGMALVAAWVRLTRGRIELCTRLAHYAPRSGAAPTDRADGEPAAGDVTSAQEPTP